jgi:uncharacterized protein YlxW (UPF0749 family)
MAKIRSFFEIQQARELFHLRQIKRRQLTIAIICAVLAFLVIIQLNIEKNVQVQLSSQTPAELGQIIRNMSVEKDSLRDEIQNLKLQLLDYEKLKKNQKLSYEKAVKNLEAMKIASGIGKVAGPGVTVKINDKNGIIAAYDLIDLVHELRASGAEAISINNDRVIGHTSIYNSSGLKIDGRKIKSPFIVRAIGSSSILEQALNMPGGYKATISSLPGVRVEIKKVQTVRLPSAKGER